MSRTARIAAVIIAALPGVFATAREHRSSEQQMKRPSGAESARW
jgi:Flp pilus assembly protein TadB